MATPEEKMSPEEQAIYEIAWVRVATCQEKGDDFLDLSELGLTRIPPRLFQLTTLKELFLFGNALTSLPPQIGKLKLLKQLHLGNNRLTTLPSEIGELKALEELYLNSNQLTSLPPGIGQLTKLKVLWGHKNLFSSLPTDIEQLTQLSSLRFHDNRLTYLPPELGELKSLKNLWIANNRLTSLPPEIGKLSALTELGIEGNGLESLPTQMLNLERLKTLWLHNNPALGLPPDVLGPTFNEFQAKRLHLVRPKAILDYYFAKQTQGVAPMQEVRVLMVGRGRVGKTSLLKTLRGKECDEKEPETPGITVLPLQLECEQGEATAHTWDFGGQEFLHGTHQIFLSERCIYILVLEGRDGNWELETDYWLRFIQSFGGDSPVIVALNKYKAHAFSVDRFRLQERCPQIVGFVETDAIRGDGVDILRGLLERTVNGMEHVWAGVPKKYHRIKEALADTPDSYLEYNDYQALCARYEVTDEGEQESLAENLHRLGIALNFRDHHRLKQTSVLKPQWVTEGIYGLLRYAQAKDCGGVLEKSWIGQALPMKDYPPKKHGFVLELMEKFEVAFALESPNKEEAPSRWLIPELLPEVQPAAFDEFRAQGVKRLRFTYPEALPPGLLPRLIVRTHDISSAHPEWRWRSGVVLEWNGCRALVRLDRSQRQTTVEVIGSEDEQRQGLFDIIRAHMTTLHGKVPYVEEVQPEDAPDKWVSMQDLRLAEREADETVKVTVGEGTEAKRIKLPVVGTLDAVESKESRVAAGPEPEKRMQLFISYAHANEKEISPIKPHLTLLSQRGYIQVWNDRDLIAGECWETGILDALNKADIVLLFYTTAARTSKFIQEKELTIALDRADAGQCTLIWVPLERSDLLQDHVLEARLSKLQCATRDAKGIFDFERESKGWFEVEESIRKVAEMRRKI